MKIFEIKLGNIITNYEQININAVLLYLKSYFVFPLTREAAILHELEISVFLNNKLSMSYLLLTLKMIITLFY